MKAADLINQIVEARPPQGSWIVGSLRGSSLDELYGEHGDTVLVVLQDKGNEHNIFPTVKRRRIGIVGSASEYGAPGTVVDNIYIDSMQGGPGTYRKLGDWSSRWVIVNSGPATNKFAKEMGVRALYHFD